MMYESCTLIGGEQISVYNLKLCLPKNAPKTTRRDDWYVQASLPVGGNARAYPTRRSSLKCYLSLVNMSIQKKIKKMTYYFQKYLWSENQAIWLDQGILGHNLWSRIFPYIGFEQDYYIFHFRLLPWKWNLKILWKLKKTPFWTPFAKRKIRFCHFFMFLDLSCCAGFF